jgi:RimJ/RimL family protein N-acetyltransferase
MAAMVYRADMRPRSWLPEQIVGKRVVLRRHAPANLAAFLRWYADPEIARLTRYQAGPMRPDEIERFFAARVLGPDTLALAIHVLETDRLVGTCAFSQLDGDNGSALYHITLGEHDAWGRGLGTEATDLMLEHAFDHLGLHRVSLTVFGFNERAVASYRKSGFVHEGTLRQAVSRDGRYWDEIQMAILEDEWRRRSRVRRDAVERVAPADAGEGIACAGAGERARP